MLPPSFDYNFGRYVQTLKIRPNTSFNLSLKKSFMKDRLRLSIDAYDIFNKNKDRIVWRINNVNLRQRFNQETASSEELSPGVSARLKKLKNRVRQRGNVSPEIERRRMTKGFPLYVTCYKHLARRLPLQRTGKTTTKQHYNTTTSQHHNITTSQHTTQYKKRLPGD